MPWLWRLSMLKPGSTIGILGGGQLGAMLASAACEMGFKTHIYAPDNNSPAFQRTNLITVAPYEDLDALSRFAASVDVVSYEFENVPIAPLQHIQHTVPIRPGIKALETAQDRLVEKDFLKSCGARLASYAEVNSLEDLQVATQEIGYPCVLKTRRFGYDGKGQIVLREGDDLSQAWSGLKGAPCVLEAFVDFFAETSLIAARAVDGTIAAFEMALNTHKNHILHTTQLPCGLPEDVLSEADKISQEILTRLDYIGVMGIEFFVAKENDTHVLYVNEIAPRVHNSGHWTQDGCLVDQFEQHIRAIAGWPLGAPVRHSNIEMINLIGDDIDQVSGYLDDPRCKVHLYGKAEARLGRKMGHVNHLLA
ncbi:MAG: 5-(carboxyamino)imidazole ribonucleotide synthase [Hyphomicrobiales bacterium]|nr:5-(carboxyamino)imidazole ribonucleotide synthase [Hyphomicrobiales bacterium]PCJ92767.1 MAG: 5-(carboxyamino)imidazole ribonucleotide synthase [Hyphomicrobiales bacterium]